MFIYSNVLRLMRAATLALLLLPLAAWPSEMTLREALQRTLRSNPDLSAYQHLLAAQDGRIVQAGLKPNPILSGTLENVLGSGEVRGLRAAELSLSLSQLVELGGLREVRVSVARGERERLEVEGHVRRLDALADTARRFVAVASQQQLHQLTHLAVELAEKTAAAVDRRVNAAKSPLAEQHRARVALERARNDDAHAEHELNTARYELAASWGVTEPGFDAVAADLYALTPLADYPQLVSELENTPDFTRYLSESRLRDAEIRLALAGRRSGVEVGVGLRRLQASGDTALLFSAAVALPVFNRNQGAIVEAQARRAAVDADRAAALVKARTALFGHYQELLDRRREVEALTLRALPDAESALANTEYAYERGRYGYLELIDAQRELLAVKRDRIAAATQFHLTLIEIERLTGTAVSDLGAEAVAVSEAGSRS